MLNQHFFGKSCTNIFLKCSIFFWKNFKQFPRGQWPAGVYRRIGHRLQIFQHFPSACTRICLASDQIHLLEKQKNRKSHPIHLGTHFNRTYGYDNACAGPLLGDLSSLNDKKILRLFRFYFNQAKVCIEFMYWILSSVLSSIKQWNRKGSCFSGKGGVLEQRVCRGSWWGGWGHMAGGRYAAAVTLPENQ
jgi:hypothetical protein